MYSVIALVYGSTKTKQTMKKSLLTIASASLMMLGAHAAPVTASPGDVFLAFEDTVQNKNYLVDLGPGSNLSSFTSLNIGSDLATVFGGSWSTDVNLYYGVYGINSGKTQAWGSVLTGNNALPYKASGALGSALSGYSALANNFNAELPTQGLSQGVYFNVGSGLDQGTATWTGNHPTASGTAAFGTYNASLEAAVSLNQTLDVYKLAPSPVAAIFSALNNNALGINSSGLVQVVPEPSTYALAGLGALLLVIAYRRNTKTAKDT